MVPGTYIGGNQYQRQGNQYQSWWNQYQIMFYLLHNYQNLRELSGAIANQDPLKLVVANARPSFFKIFYGNVLQIR